MKLHIVIMSLFFWFADNALAAEVLELPLMDFQKFCETKADFFGKNEKLRAVCLREEQRSIDFLRKNESVSFVNVPVCVNAAQAVGGSYTVLVLCLREQQRQSAENVKQDPVEEAQSQPMNLAGKPIKGSEKAFLADVMQGAFPTVAKEMGKELSLKFSGKEARDIYIDVSVSSPMTEPGLDRRLADLVTDGTLGALKKWGYAPKEDDTRVACVVFATLKDKRTRKYGTMLYDKKQDKGVWVPEADALPVYDIKQYCSRVSENMGGSARIEKTCREQEKKAYVRLQEMETAPKPLRYCDKLAGNLGGSYHMLRICIEEEAAARQSLKD